MPLVLLAMAPLATGPFEKLVDEIKCGGTPAHAEPPKGPGPRYRAKPVVPGRAQGTGPGLGGAQARPRWLPSRGPWCGPEGPKEARGEEEGAVTGRQLGELSARLWPAQQGLPLLECERDTDTDRSE